MSSLLVSTIVFACVFGGAVAGMILHVKLGEHQFSNETKDVVRLGLGLITTMTALVLGLLISTAKASYDLRRAQVTQMAAEAILADRSLMLYGPEARETRTALRDLVSNIAAQLDSSRHDLSAAVSSVPAPGPAASRVDFYRMVRELSPRTAEQKSLKSDALRISFEIGQIQALAFAQRTSSIPTPFLVVLVFWLTVLFTGYGLFAPGRVTAVTALFVCAISVAAAILMILDLDRPFAGVIQISTQPLLDALNLIDM